MSPAPPQKVNAQGGEGFEIGSEKCTSTPRLIQVAVLFFPLPPPKRGKEGRKEKATANGKTFSPSSLSSSFSLRQAEEGDGDSRKKRKKKLFLFDLKQKKEASFSTIRVMEGYTVDRDYHFIDISK